MRVKVLNIMAREDGVDRAGSNGGHVRHRANQVWLNRLVNIKPQLLPIAGVKAAGGAVLLLGAAAHMKKGFHSPILSALNKGFLVPQLDTLCRSLRQRWGTLFGGKLRGVPLPTKSATTLAASINAPGERCA